MTRIGVFSDSHGDKESLRGLLDKMGYIDAACFLGDIAPDADFLREEMAKMPNEPILYAVRGNNDLASMLPDNLLCEIGGKRIYLTHDHGVPSMLSLAYRAKENQADIALFGHTHRAYWDYCDGVLLLNPGAAGDRWHGRGGEARASVIEINRDKLNIVDVTL